MRASFSTRSMLSAVFGLAIVAFVMSKYLAQARVESAIDDLQRRGIAVYKIGDAGYGMSPLGDCAEIGTALEIARTIPLVAIAASDTRMCNDHLRRFDAWPLLRFISLARTSVSDSGVFHLSQLQAIEEIDLCNTRVTERCLEALAECQGLKRLFLSGNSFVDLPLEKLKATPKLDRLEIAFLGISNSTCNSIQLLSNLRHLNIGNNPITDDALRPMGELRRLEELDLEGISLHGFGLAYLDKCHRMERLNLNRRSPMRYANTHIRISGQQRNAIWAASRSDPPALDLSALPPLAKLSELSLVGRELRQGTLNALQHLPALIEIDLQGSNACDDDIKYLTKCSLLERLYIDDTFITEDGKAILRRALGARIALSRDEVTPWGEKTKPR